MIRFIDNLYCTKSVESKVSQIKWKTVCGIGMVSVYFITLSENGRDLFDIYSAAVFKERGFRKSNLVILGIAGSYEEATILVSDIISESIRSGTDIKNLRKEYEDYVARGI